DSADPAESQELKLFTMRRSSRGVKEPMHAAGDNIGIPELHSGGFIKMRRKRSDDVLSKIWRNRDRARTAGRPGPAEYTQYYQPPNKTNVLEIIQTADKLSQSETPPNGGHPIRIRGHTGHASRNVITWREDR